MCKVSLYIAASLDGYIAKLDGSIKWLEEFPNPEGSDFGYADFLEEVDTILMGGKTYRQVLTFGEWPYRNKECYVFSRSATMERDANVIFVKDDIAGFVRELKSRNGKVIWLVGGGEVNNILLCQGLVDEIILTCVPVLLGAGISISGTVEMEEYFEPIKTKTFKNGMIQLTFGRQKQNG
ncbi:MAG: dihydrofolate reductase family protein [Owenweeksia sp.]